MSDIELHSYVIPVSKLPPTYTNVLIILFDLYIDMKKRNRNTTVNQ